MRAQATSAISQCLHLFDFIGSLGPLSPLTSTESDFLHCIEFLYALHVRAEVHSLYYLAVFSHS